MKNKLHIIIGDIIAFLTVLTLIFIVAHSYIFQNDYNYIFFTDFDLANKIIFLMFFCATSVLISSCIFIKIRRKMLIYKDKKLIVKTSYLFEIITNSILPISNFLLVFNNVYSRTTDWSCLYDTFNSTHTVNHILYFTISPICLLFIFYSIIMIANCKIIKGNYTLFFLKLCVFENIINLVSIIFYEAIVFILFIFICSFV